MAKGIKNFRGIYMRDELPQTPYKNEAGIINLHPSHKKGSHWVSYLKAGNLVKYFDSFGGVPPPIEFVNYVGPQAEIIYNQHRFQNFGTSNCGQLAVQFLKSLKG